MSYSALYRKDSLCALARRFCTTLRVTPPTSPCPTLSADAMHMAAARLGCQKTMVGTGWANSQPRCMSKLRKCYSHLSGGSLLAEKASWALSGCLLIESADYCMLVNE